MKNRIYIRWALVFAWMTVIFCFSATGRCYFASKKFFNSNVRGEIYRIFYRKGFG